MVAYAYTLVIVEDKETITRVRLVRQRCFFLHDKVLAGSEGEAKGHCHCRPQGEAFCARVHCTRQAMHDAHNGVCHRDFQSKAKGNTHIIARSVSR